MTNAEVTQSPETGGDTMEDNMDQQEDDGRYESDDSMPPLVEDDEVEDFDALVEEPQETIGAVILEYSRNDMWMLEELKVPGNSKEWYGSFPAEQSG